MYAHIFIFTVVMFVYIYVYVHMQCITKYLNTKNI